MARGPSESRPQPCGERPYSSRGLGTPATYFEDLSEGAKGSRGKFGEIILPSSTRPAPSAALPSPIVQEGLSFWPRRPCLGLLSPDREPRRARGARCGRPRTTALQAQSRNPGRCETGPKRIVIRVWEEAMPRVPHLRLPVLKDRLGYPMKILAQREGGS